MSGQEWGDSPEGQEALLQMERDARETDQGSAAGVPPLHGPHVCDNDGCCVYCQRVFEDWDDKEYCPNHAGCASCARLRTAVIALADEVLTLKRSHRYCEDCWYSCPKAEDGCCNEAEGTDCNCGADEHNAKIEAVAARLRDAAK